MSVKISILLLELLLLLLLLMPVLLPPVVLFEAFIKLIVGLLANTAGGGGNVVGNCVGWEITPVAPFVTYIEFAEYIALGRAKSICFHFIFGCCCCCFFIFVSLFVWCWWLFEREKNNKHEHGLGEEKIYINTNTENKNKSFCWKERKIYFFSLQCWKCCCFSVFLLVWF